MRSPSQSRVLAISLQVEISDDAASIDDEAAIGRRIGELVPALLQ